MTSAAMECIQHIGLLREIPREDPMYDIMADAAILPALQALQSAPIKPGPEQADLQLVCAEHRAG